MRVLKLADVYAEVSTIEPLAFELCAFKASVNLLINDSNCPSVVAIAPCAAITEASLLKLPALLCAIASLSWASSCCKAELELELEEVPPVPPAAPAALTAVGAVLSAPVEPEAEAVVPESDVEPEAEAAAVAQLSAPADKPAFTPGRPVTAYSADELIAVVRWIDSDAVTRTDDELLRAAMKELGFARLGPRIKESLGAAVTAVRG